MVFKNGQACRQPFQDARVFIAGFSCQLPSERRPQIGGTSYGFLKLRGTPEQMLVSFWFPLKTKQRGSPNKGKSYLRIEMGVWREPAKLNLVGRDTRKGL